MAQEARGTASIAFQLMDRRCVLPVGSVYAREKRNSDQAGLARLVWSAHTKHMGDYCRGLTAHSTESRQLTPLPAEGALCTPCMYGSPYREGCVCVETPPCEIYTVYVWRDLQGGGACSQRDDG
jgi:hypothetical protein